MVYSIYAKTVRCLPYILASVGVRLAECEILDYKCISEDEKSLILIGDGRKIRPVLERLFKLNGGSNFDFCCGEWEWF